VQYPLPARASSIVQTLFVLSGRSNILNPDGRPAWVRKPRPVVIGAGGSDVLVEVIPEQVGQVDGLAAFFLEPQMNVPGLARCCLTPAIYPAPSQNEEYASSRTNADKLDASRIEFLARARALAGVLTLYRRAQLGSAPIRK
jgi:hypothetical protein